MPRALAHAAGQSRETLVASLDALSEQEATIKTLRPSMDVLGMVLTQQKSVRRATATPCTNVAYASREITLLHRMVSPHKGLQQVSAGQ